MTLEVFALSGSQFHIHSKWCGVVFVVVVVVVFKKKSTATFVGVAL